MGIKVTHQTRKQIRHELADVRAELEAERAKVRTPEGFAALLHELRAVSDTEQWCDAVEAELKRLDEASVEAPSDATEEAPPDSEPLNGDALARLKKIVDEEAS